MKLYKLTRSNCTTRENTLWVPGEWRETSGIGSLCSSGWLHAYEHPLLAILHNPIHAYIVNPRLWEAEGAGKELRDDEMKLEDY